MRAKSGKIVQRSSNYWEITTVAQLRRLFDERPYLQTGIRCAVGPTHLRADYRKRPGMVRLGFTFVRSVIVIAFNPHSGTSTFEMRVECEEGNLSREEAIGEDWIPTPDEVRKHAAEIRRKNDAAGEIRQPEYSGFALQRTYSGKVYLD